MQGIGTVIGRAVLGGASYSSEAKAIFSAMTTPPTTARKALINSVVLSMKSAGVWSLLDLLYLFAAADSQAARLNWKSPSTFVATPANSPTFTADRGYTGDGATSYVDSGYTPSSNAINLSLNSGHVGAWKQAGTTQLGAMVSVAGSGATMLVVPRQATPVSITRVNSGAGLTQAAAANFLGHVSGARLNGATETQYINGAVNVSAAAASSALEARSLIMLRSNTSYSNDTIAAMHVGGGMTDAQMLALYNALNVYLQAVGAA